MSVSFVFYLNKTKQAVAPRQCHPLNIISLQAHSKWLHLTLYGIYKLSHYFKDVEYFGLSKKVAIIKIRWEQISSWPKQEYYSIISGVSATVYWKYSWLLRSVAAEFISKLPSMLSSGLMPWIIKHSLIEKLTAILRTKTSVFRVYGPGASLLSHFFVNNHHFPKCQIDSWSKHSPADGQAVVPVHVSGVLHHQQAAMG